MKRKVWGGSLKSPVQVWVPFEPTAGFHISTPHLLRFMFKYTLHYSTTSAPCQKIPANLRKLALTTLYGAVGEGFVCRPVQVWAPFAPTVCFLFSTPHPLSFMFMCTLYQCKICTMPENTREFPQICVDSTIRRGGRRLGLQSRKGLGTF